MSALPLFMLPHLELDGPAQGKVAVVHNDRANLHEVAAWAQQQLNTLQHWAIENSYSETADGAAHGLSPYNHQQLYRLLDTFPQAGRGRVAFILPYSPRHFLLQTYLSSPRRSKSLAWDRQIFFTQDEAFAWLRMEAAYLR